MAGEQSKNTTTPSQQPEHPPSIHAQHPALAPYPYPAPFPPAGAYPPFVYATVPPDGHHDPNAPNGAPQAPFLMAYPPPPPGMVYAIAPPPTANGQPSPFFPQIAPGAVPQQVLPKPKRKQVKMACTNCAAACKRCDESRPCERCQKYGLAATCVDGIRKERKKGIKRGPYKRKNKSVSVTGDNIIQHTPPAPGIQMVAPAPPNGEAHAHEGGAPPPPVSYMMTPEGYYHYFYHPGFSSMAPPPAAPLPAPQPQPQPQSTSQQQQQNGTGGGSPNSSVSASTPSPQASQAHATPVPVPVQVPPATAHPSLSQAAPYYHQVYPPPFHYPAPGVGYPQPYHVMMPPPAPPAPHNGQGQEAAKNGERGEFSEGGKGKKRGHPGSSSSANGANGDGEDPKAKRPRSGHTQTQAREGGGEANANTSAHGSSSGTGNTTEH